MDYISHPIEDGPMDEMELELLTADGKLDKDAYIFEVWSGGRSMLARVRDTGLTTFSNNYAILMRDYQLTGRAGRKKEFSKATTRPITALERSSVQERRIHGGPGNGIAVRWVFRRLYQSIPRF